MTRRVRMVLIISGAVVLVVAAAFALVQVALWTPLPRAVVEDKLGELLGRRVRMDAIGVGWGSHSRITDLRVLSYDHRHVALYVPEAEADHAELIQLLLGDHVVRSFTARHVEVGRHITWLKLDTVEARRTDGGDTLVMEVTGEAEGMIKISGLDDDDEEAASVQLELNAPKDAIDPPFTYLALDAQIEDNAVTSLTVQTERLDLGPLILAVSPSVGQVYGRLTGNIAMTIPDGELSRANGVGEALIADSDFVDIPLFASIYDVLRLSSSASERSGHGSMKFRMQNGALLIDEMDYTNRGAYIEIAGRITDPFKGGDAALDAYAVASLKPLPDESVLKVVNSLLGLLQEQVNTIHVTGTLAEQKLKPEPLKSVGDRIGNLLGVPPKNPTESAP